MWAAAGPTWRYLTPRLHEHFVPFLDLQYLYGLARAGEQRPSPRCWRAWKTAPGTPSPSSARPGPLHRARRARTGRLRQGDCAETRACSGQAMPHLQAIGGSIAQRSLFGAIHLDA
jgi:hypothetical protein